MSGTLAELQRIVHEALRGERSAEGAAEALGSDAARVALYQRFVRGHVRSALSSTFPATSRSVSDETWEILVAAYFEAHSAPNWDLDAAAEAFPDFLALQAEGPAVPEGLTPFHAALASLEWALLSAVRSEEEMPDPATLSAPVLNPTLIVLESAYLVVPYWGEWMGGREDWPYPPPGPQPQLALVFRHPLRDTGCCYTAIDDLLFALKVTHDRLDPETAARDAGLDPAAARAAVEFAASLGLVFLPLISTES